MDKVIIKTNKAPEAIGPYSQGVIVGDMLFTSGQIPIDVATGTMPETITDQTRIVLENIKGVVEEAGLKMDNVIKMTVFLTDMKNFKEMNDVYKSFFDGDFPSRSCVEVSRLPKDALIEIEAIAHF